MKNEEAIREARAVIWYNLAPYPTTQSRCRHCKTGSGRGGGKCLACAQNDLGELIGHGPAAEYVSTIETLRRLEAEQLET